MATYIINTDGGARGNPGPAGAGWIIADSAGAVLKKGSRYLGTCTNNWAEYEAVALALQDLKKIVPKGERASAKITLYLDSELVARQLSNEYQIKEESLFSQYIKVHNICVADFPNITFVHVPREKNGGADELANVAMDGHSGDLFEKHT